MTKRKWFRAPGPAASGDPFLAALLRLLARPSWATAQERSQRSADAGGDSGAEACWTANLSRGDDLPPCRLSILSARGAPSAIRLETFGREPGSDGRRRGF